MPLYEYKCERCDEVFEVLQKFSDTPLSLHEGCGGKVSRLLSTSALQFKGSGWYITDYAKSGKSSKVDPGSKDKSSGKADSSTTSSAPAASTSTSSESAKK